jgi:hypothetical protein
VKLIRLIPEESIENNPKIKTITKHKMKRNPVSTNTTPVNIRKILRMIYNTLPIALNTSLIAFPTLEELLYP